MQCRWQQPARPTSTTVAADGRWWWHATEFQPRHCSLWTVCTTAELFTSCSTFVWLPACVSHIIISGSIVLGSRSFLRSASTILLGTCPSLPCSVRLLYTSSNICTSAAFLRQMRYTDLCMISNPKFTQHFINQDLSHCFL
jgi:hypothetical protein